MTKPSVDDKDPAAVKRGRLGGQATSKAKARAAKRNGKRGGRPLNRYYVHTRRSGVNAVPNPYWVVDRSTNLPVDEYDSQFAAAMHARQLNAAEKRAR